MGYLEALVNMLSAGDIDDPCDAMKAFVLPYLQLCVAETTGIPHTIYAGWTADASLIYKYTRVKGVFIDYQGLVGCFSTSCHGGGANIGVSTGVVGGILLGDAENDFPGTSLATDIGVEWFKGLEFTYGQASTGAPFVEHSEGVGIGASFTYDWCSTELFAVSTIEDPLSTPEGEAQGEFEFVRGWRGGEASDCRYIDCTTEFWGLEACKKLCEDDPHCNLFNFCPGPEVWMDPHVLSTRATCETEWESPTNRCCLRECGPTSHEYTTTWSGWDVYVPVDACYNDYAWRSSTGKSCEDYYDLSLCEKGGYGHGWDATWGAFSNFANADGVDASHACCGCKPIEPQCIDDYEWRSSTGKSCTDYKTLSLCENGDYGEGWSASWGGFATFANADGVDASDACCDCKPRPVEESFSYNSFNYLGTGYCDAGYYAGWDAADATLERCMKKCETETECHAFALKEGVTCSRFNYNAGDCMYRPNGQSDYVTYVKAGKLAATRRRIQLAEGDDTESEMPAPGAQATQLP